MKIAVTWRASERHLKQLCEELYCCKKKRREEVELLGESRWQGAFIPLALYRPQMGLMMETWEGFLFRQTQTLSQKEELK